MGSILPTVYNLRKWPVYHELTVWSRGIIMDKEARDVSSCVATAARSLGYYADNVSDYVDDPDRTNCLVRRYARFGDSPIVDRFVYENPQPDWVVLVEETIIKAVNFLRGTPEGSGILVINSQRDPDYLLKFLPDEMKAKLAKFVLVDAVGLAEQRGDSPWMFVRNLSELALDRMSTEGAEERLAIGMGIAAPLIGALVAATGVLPVDTVADVVADRDAMLRGAAQHTVVDLAPPAPAAAAPAPATPEAADAAQNAPTEAAAPATAVPAPVPSNEPTLSTMRRP
jgi:oxalate oxidoreductase subunit delta